MDLREPRGWKSRWPTFRRCLVILVVASGCAVTRPLIFSQARPNPFIGETTFSLAPTSFSGPLHVGEKTEDEYLAENPDDVNKWADAKKSFNDAFTQAVITQDLWAPNAKFTVRPTVRSIRPGAYGVSAMFAQKPADLQVEVSIVDQQGNELDRIGMHPSSAGISVEDRLGRCGRAAGTMTVEYLRTRLP